MLALALCGMMDAEVLTGRATDKDVASSAAARLFTAMAANAA